MNNAIVPVSSEAWQTIQSIAPVATASRMFSVTEQQAAIVMLKGHELGLGIASAFEFIHVIDGKPGVSPKGALALIHQSGELAGLKIEDQADDKGNPTACRVWMKRKNGFEYTASFTMDDAKRAGVVRDGSGWDKYPANMLRWRAVGYCADVVFPDVIGGMYRPEELGAAVDAEGEPVEGTWGVVEAKAHDAPSEPPQEAVEATEKPVEAPTIEMTVNGLLAAGYTAEQIMVSNEGRIPATSEECAVVLGKLEAANGNGRAS